MNVVHPRHVHAPILVVFNSTTATEDWSLASEISNAEVVRCSISHLRNTGSEEPSVPNSSLEILLEFHLANHRVVDSLEKLSKCPVQHPRLSWSDGDTGIAEVHSRHNSPCHLEEDVDWERGAIPLSAIHLSPSVPFRLLSIVLAELDAVANLDHPPGNVRLTVYVAIAHNQPHSFSFSMSAVTRSPISRRNCLSGYSIASIVR